VNGTGLTPRYGIFKHHERAFFWHRVNSACTRSELFLPLFLGQAKGSFIHSSGWPRTRLAATSLFRRRKPSSVVVPRQHQRDERQRRFRVRGGRPVCCSRFRDHWLFRTPRRHCPIGGHRGTAAAKSVQLELGYRCTVAGEPVQLDQLEVGW